MTKKFSKKNGYYKYYNKDGKWCRIKFKVTPEKLNKKEILIAFLLPNEVNWMYHSPKTQNNKEKKFNNVFEVINFICKNLETYGTIFKVF